MKKKTKWSAIAALSLSLALLAPIGTLFACDDGELSNDSAQAGQSSDSAQPLPESSSSANESAPPQSSPSEQTPPSSVAPEAPETPETSAPVETPETPTVPAVQTAQYIRCTGSNVNLRTGAGTSFSVLGQAETGTVYAVIGKTGNWYKTYYKNKTAYLYAEYATVFSLEKTNAKTEAVIEEGYKLIGVPYVYGAVRLHDGNGNLLKGFSAQKFDCSSLIQYIFYKGAGVNLNVNTRTQVTQGKYVKPSNLQRGDCIYFTNAERENNVGIERIGHVALYLGNDYILHTASDYARIEKMSAKRWNYYVEARRFL